MRLLHLSPGTGDFHCGACIRDHALVRELVAMGHQALIAPMYLPAVLDEPPAPAAPLFFGGLNVYLQHKSILFRHTPRWIDRLLDAPALLVRLARASHMTRPDDLGELTLSMLRGSDGRQTKEIHRLIAWASQHFQPDVICLSNAMLLGLAAPLRQALKAPVVCTLQGEDTFLDHLAQPYRTQAWALLAQRAREADALLSVSRFYAQAMSRRLDLAEACVHVVPNGIDLSGYPPPPAAPPNPPVIGFLSRLCPAKGLHTFVEAFIILRRHGWVPHARLAVAGNLTRADRPYVTQLRGRLAQAGLEGEANFTANIDRAAKLAFLHGLSAFSVPAAYDEAFGLYVLEALAAGVPVVQPERGAFPEILAATGGGILCKADDPEDLADKLLELLTNTTLAATLAGRGRAAVHQHFSARRMAEQVLAVCQGAVTPPGRYAENSCG